MERKVEKVRDITRLLQHLQDPPTELVLLRSCLALPKIFFLLQTVNTTRHKCRLQEFDRITREALIRILGSPVRDRAWQQAKLPVVMGGLGLRCAEDQAPAAYAASLLASQPLTRSLQDRLHCGVDLDGIPGLPPHLLDAMSAAQGEEAKKDDLVGLTQRQMVVKVDLHQQKLLLQDISQEEVRKQARLALVALPPFW